QKNITIKNISIPFCFGKPQSVFPLLCLFVVPDIIFVFSLIFFNLFSIVFAILLLFMIYGSGFYDFRRYYSYFVITDQGIIYSPYQNKYTFFPFVEIIKGAIGKRKEAFVPFKEIKFGKINFDTDGFKGFNTSVIFRPRYLYFAREEFTFIIIQKNQNRIALNFDVACYPNSLEREVFCALFKYINSKGVKIKDRYSIINSFCADKNFITEAYKNKINIG
ncbi:hypothetical protein POA89_002984, partial [Enterococcus faecalis]|nr:hypothetical protein [Enterococcus faecalis]